MSPLDAQVAGVMATIGPANDELADRWADALASVGGLYATFDRSGLAVVARGSLSALRWALDRGVTSLPAEVARRYVDPPPYRRQPLHEFVLASLRVDHAVRQYLAAHTPNPEVCAVATARVSEVMAGALLQVVRLREQRLSAGQLLTDVGRLLGTAAPGVSLERVAARVAAEVGAGCVLLGVEGGALVRIACVGPDTSDPGCWPARLEAGEGSALAPLLEGQPLSLPLTGLADPLLERIARAGFAAVEARPLQLASEVVGAVLLLEQQGRPFEPRSQGHVEYVAPLLAAHVALARSTGALVQADAAISALLEASPTMMCTLDRHGRILRTNGVFRRRIGVQDDLAGMPLSWLLHPAWQERFPAQWAQILEEPRAAAGARLDLVTADPGRLALATEARWLRDEVDPPRTCLLALWDVGQYVRRAEADAHQIDALDAFATQIGHDLRAPLRSVAGFASLLAEALEAGEVAEARACAARIEAAVVRMDDLIEGLTRYARSASLDPARHEVSPQQLFNDALGRLEGLAAARGIALSCREDGARLLGDRAALGGLLANLLDNAIRHSPQGGTIEVALEASAPGWARLSVSDAGPGVPAAERERVFGLFQRGEGAAAQSGIGLAIVRRVARAHGGDVQIDDGPLGGARFTVLLPTA